MMRKRGGGQKDTWDMKVDHELGSKLQVGEMSVEKNLLEDGDLALA